ncbi:C40 family peptidase [Ihubacter sp. rT4E-8]|uniref:C40 family peptidase n=1 Tax=unclassified Ihubacter TaxID=2633299 RepID=UPI0013796081
MTNPMTRVNTKIKRVFKTTASVILIALMTFVMVCGSGSGAYAAETESQNGNWAIIIGDEEILYVDSEEAGKQVIEGLKNYYLSEGSNVLDVQFDPQIQVSQIFEIADDEFAAMSGSVCDIEEAVKRLSEGKNEYYVYKTKEGDSLDSLAKEKDLIADKLVKLNFDEYESDETIKEGTYIVLYKEVPYVHVTTVEEVTSTKSIDYDTVYKKTSSLKKGEMKIQKKGKKGQKQVVRQLTKVNGKTTSSELISSEVIQEPTDKVVLKGTGTVTAKAGKTFDFVDGSEVVDYAKNFIGNPYSYGGTSLTNGADCSGFVYSIFKHFGVNLPRVGQSGVGKAVSYKNVKKGDILIYPGHVAIYAGNGKAIHAVNERLGIRITSVGYTGSVIAVRRIFD